MRFFAACLMLGVSVCAGCAQAPATTAEPAEKPELTPELKSFVLEQAPSDIAHPLYVDFNGKAELVGYALEPEGTAAPGTKLTLKLYFRSTGALDAGYAPFAELVTPNGRRIDVSGSGPMQGGALSPANWETGKVYIDELPITVPTDINAARFSIVVGFKTQPIALEERAEDAAKKDDKKDDKKAEKATEAVFSPVYLSVLSGPADPKHGAVIATVETGVTPGVQRVAREATKRSGKPAAMARPGTAQ
jgi:hypothetical protein